MFFRGSSALIFGADFLVDFFFKFGVLFKIVARFFSALRKFFAVIAEPCARFLDHAVLYADIEQAPFLRNALTVNNIELRGFERGRKFVFNYFRSRFVADKPGPRL